MLEVRLFGKFDIKDDGKPVIISSRVAQSLFAYLILNAGTSYRREKLAGMFWPDTAEEKARAYLRHELWRIRKAIPSQEFLLSNDIGIAFNSSIDYWLDTQVLEKLTEAASPDELMAALSAYHGELLPGFYDEWIILEREHLQTVYEQKIARLLEFLESEKRWNEILEWAERWISFGQGSEAAYRYLMVAYEALGDRAKVASTYERCLQALRELDLEPSQQTRALAFKRTSKLNIPIPMTSFIGRETELKEVAALLSKSRLVTLTGSGGVGKTRLAIQVVAEILDRFPDGVWFIDFAPLSDPALVPQVVFKTLGLVEQPGRSLEMILTDFLQTKRALLILDNCEHLIQACAQIAETLLRGCHDLSILTTSREPLRIAGEVPYRVPSLEIPKADVGYAVDALMKIESTQLFVQRAESAAQGFVRNLQNAPIIAQICLRLDGIPLAIELAAARVNILTVEQVLKRLEDRFNLLAGGLRTSLPRHKTLLATMEWSYNLLSEQERILFRRLAVFSSSWTLEAAEEVCGEDDIESRIILDLLSQLVDKSLVLVETLNSGETRHPPAGSLRYRTLESIRQYTREKLSESGEEEQVRARHLDYFLKLAQKAEPELYGAGQIEWMQKLEDEQDNMRAALEWSLQGNVTSGQQLAAALWWSWYVGGRVNEGYAWLKKILDANPEDESILRAKLLSGAAYLTTEAMASKDFFEKSVEMFRRCGDETGAALALATLASNFYGFSNYDLATQMLNESMSLFERTGNNWGVAHALGYWGYLNQVHGNFEQAFRNFNEALQIAKEIGNKEMVASLLCGMGSLAKQQTYDVQAMELFEEALGLAKAAGSKPWTARILRDMGVVAIRQGDYERGILWLEETMEIYRKMGLQGGIADSLGILGWAARLQGDYARAKLFHSQSLSLKFHPGNEGVLAEELIEVGKLIATQGYPEKFARLLGMAEGVNPDIHKFMAPFFRAETERFIKHARAALGDEAYSAALEAGKQMSLDEAVACALKELK